MARKSVLDTIEEVAQKSSESANVCQVKMIGNENLHDYPENHEDITRTDDLEKSIEQCGFTTPIDVTDFNMPDGEYTILAGHRRRAAGVKKNMTTFPCIIRHFNAEAEVRNYVLMLNSQRDSSKEPLLMFKRYMYHENYLKSIDFAGSFRDEIKNRMGISIQQVDRYKQFTKVIVPVWDMVAQEQVGMSSVVPMASHPEAEQEEILKILNECLNQGDKLTRDKCDEIIKGYRNGMRTYADILNANAPAIIAFPQQQQPEAQETHDSGLPLNPYMNTDPPKAHEDNPNQNLHEDGTSHNDNDEPTETNHSEGKGESNGAEHEKHPPLSETEKQLLNGENISKYLSKLEGCLNEFYSFEDKNRAKAVMNTMGTMVQMMVEELNNIATEYKQAETFNTIINNIDKDMKSYLTQK